MFFRFRICIGEEEKKSVTIQPWLKQQQLIFWALIKESQKWRVRKTLFRTIISKNRRTFLKFQRSHHEKHEVWEKLFVVVCFRYACDMVFNLSLFGSIDRFRSMYLL